jgi:DNA polymerase III sliding clamp (beta) subunit (PCNA family)
VRVSAADAETWFALVVDADGVVDTPFLVDADTFLYAVGKASKAKGPVSLAPGVISTSAGRYIYSPMDWEQHPSSAVLLPPRDLMGQLFVRADTLAWAWSIVRHTVPAKYAPQPVFEFVLLEHGEDGCWLVGTDTHRLAAVRLEAGLEKGERLLLPPKFLNLAVSAVPGDAVWYGGRCQADGWNCLAVTAFLPEGELTLLARLSDLKWPQWRSVIPGSSAEVLAAFVVNKQVAALAEQAVAVLPKSKHPLNPVLLAAGDDKVRIVVRGDGVAQYDASVPAEAEGAANKAVRLNAGYLAGALAALQGRKVELLLAGASRTIPMVAVRDDELIYLLLGVIRDGVPYWCIP